MVNVENLTVKITYRVGLGDVDIPENVYQQLVEAANNGDDIEMEGKKRYYDAYEWLVSNIEENSCMDWACEIEDISFNLIPS